MMNKSQKNVDNNKQTNKNRSAVFLLVVAMKTFLPKGSVVKQGFKYISPSKDFTAFQIYRYNPNNKDNPRVDTFEVARNSKHNTVLDVLIHVKEQIDETLSFRKSCKEGSCGSCAMNIDGENKLACVTSLPKNQKEVKIYPLPHMKVVRDLVCDMDNFFDKYKSIKPWIIRENNPKTTVQLPKERKKIEGLYECIMCAACSTGCPSYWWNESEFLGPAVFIQASRWINDSRDGAKAERLEMLRKQSGINDCHSIFGCTQSCPKKLNPALAIANLKNMLS